MYDRQLAEMGAAFQNNPEAAANGAFVKTPQFPGQQKGFSIEAIRSLIKKQKRCRGFLFNLTISNQTFNLSNISGTARIFLGFVISFEPDTPANFPPFMNLTVNNEVIIQDVDPDFFTQRYMDDEYYFFPRPLSGQDNIILQVQGSAAPIVMNLAVYYI